MCQSKRSNTKGSAVPSVGDPGCDRLEKLTGRPGLPLGSLAPHAVIPMPLRGNTGH